MSAEVSSLLGGAISAGASVAATKKQFKRQKKILKNRIQWQVSDLKAAGLNPILAAGASFGAGGTPSVAAPNIPNFGDLMNNSAKAGVARKKLQPEARLLASQADESETRSNVNRHSVRLVDEQAMTEMSKRDLLDKQQQREANTAESLRLQNMQQEPISMYYQKYPEAVGAKHFLNDLAPVKWIGDMIGGASRRGAK